MSVPRRSSWLIAVALGLAVAAVYGPVAEFGYVDLDDNEYVFENRLVQSGWTSESVRWAWTAYHSGHWHPLTWLSLMLDFELFGASPAAAHGVNVGLHALGVMLLFGWLQRATGRVWVSAFVAACFALHPLRVESVAWIAARKDVLSGCLLMLTLSAYVAYAQRGGLLHYVGVVLAYGLGLLAKPTLAVVPFGLLLLDVWPLRRIDPARIVSRQGGLLAAEKLPLLVLAAATLRQTAAAQQAAGAWADATVPFGERLANALCSYVAYLGKTLWPSDLAVFYPLVPVPTSHAIASAALLGLLTLVVVGLGRRYPAAFVGWAWYVGTAVPVIGLVQFGGQAMADRYTYIPHIGLLAGGAFAVAEWLEVRRVPRWGASLVALLVLVALATVSRQQLAHWRDSRTLFERALQVTESNYMAHNNLGVFLERHGETDLAAYHYEQAVRANPTWPDALLNYGNTFAWRGQYAAAAQQYQAALTLRPNFATAENNLATALAYQGDLVGAVPHYERAVALRPDYFDARYALADAYERLGRYADAYPHYEWIVAARPDWPPGQAAWQRTRAALGR